MKRWWLYLIRYAFPEWRGLLVIALGTFLTIGVKLLSPWPLKLIVDYAVVERPLPEKLEWVLWLPGSETSRGLLAWFAGATILLFLTKRCVRVALNYIQSGVGSRMVYCLATDLFRHLQNRSIAFHGRHRVGDLVKRVTSDCGCVQDLILQVFLPLMSAVVTLTAMFLVMWQLSPVCALFALVLALPLGLTTRFFAGPMTERVYREQELQGELMSLAEQTLAAVPLVQAFGREKCIEDSFRGMAGRNLRATLRTLVSQQQFNVSTATLSKLAIVAVMTVGGFSVLHGNMTVGSLLVLLSYFSALFSPIETLAYLGVGFASAKAGARRVLEVLEGSDCASVAESPNAIRLPSRPGRIGASVRLDHVTFGYEAKHPILHDVSFEAQPGEVIALVGRTGAGKSTLVSLIARLYDPWHGSVELDGVDLRKVKLDNFREKISIVMQEPFLFRMTVAENIAYGRPNASREAIIDAARAAAADEFIQTMPHGYDTLVGERGTTLSGGQRQRLSIARAFLKDAPVLILDEPTSALDSQTESEILAAMDRLMTGRTTFLIAHRLSTVRKADRIVVLENGRIAEIGSPQELLARRDGAYSSLWQHYVGDECVF